jgi:ATP-dependent DNA helicase RecG
LADVLRNEESQQFETKRVSGKMVGKALETICAFANTAGGHLVLGVDDAKQSSGTNRLWGVQENPEAFDELVRKLRTHISPPVEGVTSIRCPCVLRDGSDGHLEIVVVKPSVAVHSIVDNGTWTRATASNREMDAAEINELSYRRGTRSAEAEPVDVDFEFIPSGGPFGKIDA